MGDKISARSRNIAGQKFGRLTAVRRVTAGRASRWLFVCECGESHEARATHVVSGAISSCGCLRRESSHALHLKHGHALYVAKKSATYNTWVRMKQRCSNPNGSHYKDYGGRGIIVCDRWNGSYEAFLSDMGSRPSNNHSIDRIDVNGNYEPGNCRWATKLQQANNTRACRRVAWDGREWTISELATHAGMSKQKLWKRLRRGWSVDRAVGSR